LPHGHGLITVPPLTLTFSHNNVIDRNRYRYRTQGAREYEAESNYTKQLYKFM